ncbi:MAG: class I SAM-dependent methyltransferase [Planctomycetota bacterium]
MVRCSECHWETVSETERLELREHAPSKADASEEAAYLDGIRGKLRRSRLYPLLFRLFAPVLVTGPDPGRRYAEEATRGVVIDLGAGNDRRHPEFVNLDLLPYPEVDIVCDGGRLPVVDQSVDAIVCVVVLEHVPDPVAVIEEASRILKPGGRLFIAIPFLQPFHAAPHDYRRWTIPGLREELRDFDEVDSGVYGGPASALTWLAAEWMALLLSFGSRKLRDRLALPLQALCSPFKWLDLILARHPDAARLASAVWMDVRKPKGAAGRAEN